MARQPEPDFAAMHAELQRDRHLTLQLLWEEYRAVHPDGYGYSRYCELYQRWRRKLDVVLRQEHRAGEKLFVDYAGRTVAVKNPTTGDLRQAQLFVAVLGASNYTFAEATWTQGLADWIGSQCGPLSFFKAVPKFRPDNLSGVTQARYASVNLAKVEAGVLVADPGRCASTRWAMPASPNCSSGSTSGLSQARGLAQEPV